MEPAKKGAVFALQSGCTLQVRWPYGSNLRPALETAYVHTVRGAQEAAALPASANTLTAASIGSALTVAAAQL